MKDCTLFKMKKPGKRILAESRLHRLGMFVLAMGLTSFSFGQTVTTTIGSGDGSSITVPVKANDEYSYSQQIYLATDFNEAVRWIPSQITKIRFYYMNGPFTNSNDWTVYIGSTAKTQFASFTDWVPLADMQQVFTGTLPNPSNFSWMEITLDTPFQWDGVSNVVVAVDENKPASSGLTSWRSQPTGPDRSMVCGSNTNPDPAAPLAASFKNSVVPQVQFVHQVAASCSGTPAPGNTISSLASPCVGENFTLSMQNNTTGPGVSYQWQSSPNGTTWTNIGGATGSTLVTSQMTATYYRCAVTCTGNTGNSSALQVNRTGPVYATLPVNESFESWSNMCGGTTNVPSNFWLTTPLSGNSSWRREDQGASASWILNATGMYTPAFSQGAHSARFHTGAASNNAQGKLDLYVNCSAGNLEKKLTFDYINTGGTDKLRVFLSTDGGQNFTQQGADILTASTWTSQSRTFTSSSATTVVRLLAISDVQPSDIGIDNFNLQSVVVCNMPTALTVGGLTATAANISWTAPTPVPSGGYEYVLSTTNTAPTTGGTSISATAYNASALVPNTNYYFFVRSACGSGSFSDWASIPFTTLAAPCVAPTSPAVSAITATTASISWTAPSPAPTGGYEYVLSTTNTAPTAGGTAVSATVYNASALIQNTNYYFFVRAVCGGGSFSEWISIPFKTKSTSGVEDLEAILGLSIFPNPAGETVTVRVNESAKVSQISLRNITGALILSVKATGNKETFSLAQLAAGAYLMEIETDRGTLTKEFHVIH